MESSSTTAAPAAISINRLATLHEQVEGLRAQLRRAFVDDAPRLEMDVFLCLRDLVENHLRPWFEQLLLGHDKNVLASTGNGTSNDGTFTHNGASTDEAAAAQACPAEAEARVVSTYYMQEVLAAALYLSDDMDSSSSSSAHNRYDVGSPPTPPAEDKASESSSFYVSNVQRKYCAQVIFFLCHWAPAHVTIQALYPLLNPAPTTTPTIHSSAPLQNKITPEFLRHTRFRKKRVFIARLLNGVVLSRTTGVRALVRVLLLDDRVESTATLDAAACIVKLLTARMKTAWMHSNINSEEVQRPSAAEKTWSSPPWVGLQEVSLEHQVQLVSQQLIPLFEEHAAVSLGDRVQQTTATAITTPAFLQRLQSNLLPQETLEERLHICMVMLANRFLNLPSRQSQAFNDAYKAFFYFNKYFLTPAFAPLSMRSKQFLLVSDTSHEPNHVLEGVTTCALRRLLSLAKGSEGAASAHSLLTVIEAVAPGILCLSAVYREESTAQGLHGPCLKQLWKSLFAHSSCVPELALALVRGCTTPVNGVYTRAANLLELRLCYIPVTTIAAATRSDGGGNGLEDAEVSDADGRVKALVQVVFQDCFGECPCDLQNATIVAMATECQIQLFGTTGQGAPRARTGETSLLLAALEELCVALPADALFGARATLTSVLDTLKAVAPLSAVCLRWVTSLTPRLCSAEALDAIVKDITDGGCGGDGGGIVTTTSALLKSMRSLRRLFTTFLENDHAAIVVLHSQLESELTSQDGIVELRQCIEASRAALDAAERIVEAAAVPAAVSAAVPIDAGVALSAVQSPPAAAAAAAGRDNKGGSSGSAVELSLVREWSRLTERAALLIETQSIAPLCVSLMRLADSIEVAATVTMKTAPGSALRQVAGDLIHRVLLRVLLSISDACAAAHAIRCLVWLGMYRFDSADTSLLARALRIQLLAATTSKTSQSAMSVVMSEDERVLWSAMGISSNAAVAALFRDRERIARMKVRLLDVLLSWCDYDHAGRTLRNVDDYMRRDANTSGGGLYSVLAALCGPTEESVVQVAALHLVGNYVVAMYPRVPLGRVCALCKDVFRHTSLEMAKAACASMLAAVTVGLCGGRIEQERGGLDGSEVNLMTGGSEGPVALTAIEVRELKELASALASYQSDGQKVTVSVDVVKGSAAAGTSLLDGSAHADKVREYHDEVVRRHGRDILQLLKQSTCSVLISEISAV